MAGAEEIADEISKLYLKSSRYLSLELDQIFERFQKKHRLSEKEARELLNKLQDRASIDELKGMLRQEDGNKKQLLAELEAPAYQARMERLQQLQNQIDMTMRQVYQQEKIRNATWYLDLANEAYYRSIFDIQQQAGVAFGFSLVSPNEIDRVINSKWSGKNYSTRIWSNTQALAQTLKEELLLSLVTGRTDRETAEIIANKFASGASAARRLVRTESNFLAGEMSAAGYQECGIEYYIYLATLDLKTCKEDCAPLDGKRFKVSEREPGKNYHPMHPWCRCTDIADISEEELSRLERAVRDPVTGKTMKVPAGMNYGQWYEKYVKGRPEAELNEKKIRNRSADRKQYEQYKKVLGDDVPEKLDDFQQMKYTDTEKWKFVKLDYKRRTDLLAHPEKKLPNAGNVVLPDRKFTHYLFGGDKPEGLAKGKALTSRLGYDISNWKEFQDEIRTRAEKYPITVGFADQYGLRYEQKMIIYGKNGKPANVIVGWIQRMNGDVSMASAYIKEAE